MAKRLCPVVLDTLPAWAVWRLAKEDFIWKILEYFTMELLDWFLGIFYMLSSTAGRWLRVHTWRLGLKSTGRNYVMIVCFIIPKFWDKYNTFSHKTKKGVHLQAIFYVTRIPQAGIPFSFQTNFLSSKSTHNICLMNTLKMPIKNKFVVILMSGHDKNGRLCISLLQYITLPIYHFGHTHQ